MTNEDVTDIYERVKIGAKVFVLSVLWTLCVAVADGGRR